MRDTPGMQVGDVAEGVVQSVKPYGAFIDLGNGVTGLLHVSQLSSTRVQSIDKVLAEGDKIKVGARHVSGQGEGVGAVCAWPRAFGADGWAAWTLGLGVIVVSSTSHVSLCMHAPRVLLRTGKHRVHRLSRQWANGLVCTASGAACNTCTIKASLARYGGLRIYCTLDVRCGRPGATQFRSSAVWPRTGDDFE